MLSQSSRVAAVSYTHLDVYKRQVRDTPVGFDALEPALALSDSTDAFLAYTGDKRFLLADEGDAFLMYRVQGGNWIVMGDPVGNEDRWADLSWKLREMADAAQGRIPVSYTHLDVYKRQLQL